MLAIAAVTLSTTLARLPVPAHAGQVGSAIYVAGIPLLESEGGRD